MQRIGFLCPLVALAFLLVMNGNAFGGAIEIGTMANDPAGGDAASGVCTGNGDQNSGQTTSCEAVGSQDGLGGPDAVLCPIAGPDPFGGMIEGSLMDLEGEYECHDSNSSGAIVVTEQFDDRGNLTGYTIRHGDGAEVMALCVAENYRSVEMLTVTVGRANLQGRFAKFPSERLNDGQVIIGVNGRDFTFSTSEALHRGATMNRIILNRLVREGYDVSDTGDYIIVQADDYDLGVHTLKYAADSMVTTASDVSIEPRNFENYPRCFSPDADLPGKNSGGSGSGFASASERP